LHVPGRSQLEGLPARRTSAGTKRRFGRGAAAKNRSTARSSR
jgi:hypothetical protein